jgi:hypothetical protein
MALCVVLLMRGCDNEDTKDIETVEADKEKVQLSNTELLKNIEELKVTIATLQND